MKPWFISLWTDEAKFAAMMRGLVFFAGTLPEFISFGDAGKPAWVVGKILQGAALFIRAGDKNQKEPPTP